MKIRSWFLAALTALAVVRPDVARADKLPEPALMQEPAAPAEPTEAEIAAMIAQYEATLHYQRGEIKVADGRATLQVPAEFRFLGAEDARRLLEQAWGNPPDDKVLGMLFPSDTSPLDPERGWGVVITYDDSGHVDDADAKGIDYDELLAAMKAAQSEANAQRTAQGFSAVEMRGWAEPPHYDEAAHKLYWAMQLHFGQDPVDTLNYAIRVLGREGVLELNAVAPLPRMAEVKPGMEKILEFVSFTSGNRYADYDESSDKLATYGIGGLIAGGLVASKTGLLKGLWLALLAGKKFVVIGLIALGVFLKKLFSRKSNNA